MQKKTCFIITPIGENNTEYREKMDDVIDTSIIPLLHDEYDVIVPHRMKMPGSITEQIILSICSADLVIANLTSLNPNVMFELAIRLSSGSPTIQIAEESTKLPFDLFSERTIFYRHTSKGLSNLSSEILEFLCNMDFDVRMGTVYEVFSKFYTVKDVKNELNDQLVKLLLKEIEDLNAEAKTSKKLFFYDFGTEIPTYLRNNMLHEAQLLFDRFGFKWSVFRVTNNYIIFEMELINQDEYNKFSGVLNKKFSEMIIKG